MKLSHMATSVAKGITRTAEVAGSLKGIYDTGKYLYGVAQVAAPYIAAASAVL